MQSPPLSDSHGDRLRNDASEGGRPGGAIASTYQVQASATWTGVELLIAREDISRQVHWAIDKPEHTVIVHLGGVMRELDTEIEGVGATGHAPSPGDIWLVPANTRYSSQARGGVIQYAELRLHAEAAVDLPDGNRAPLRGLVPRLGHRDEFLYHSISQLGQLVRSEDDLSTMMAARLQELLRQHLYRNYQPRATPLDTGGAASPSSLSPRVARRIGDFIESHLDRRISLAELAALADISVNALLIAFRRNFGTTPAQYILEQRLRQARWRLLNTLQDIGEIAIACGFANHSHFSESFRRNYSITPSEFRYGLRTRSQN